jgi:hypothetical protein
MREANQKANGKGQKAKVSRVLLPAATHGEARGAIPAPPHFCLLPFAICLLICLSHLPISL